jgi:small subunit ribosomal protein S9
MAENEKKIDNPEMAAEKSEAKEPAAEVKKAAAVVEPRKIALTGKVSDGGFVWGTGRRKSSVARVRIRPGDGKFLINKREIDKFFSQVNDRNAVVAPLKALNVIDAFDVFVNVAGGGTTGQAGAVMLGVARALKNYDASMLKELRDGGFLTRDSREVERKKPGQSGARKRFQFSKR